MNYLRTGLQVWAVLQSAKMFPTPHFAVPRTGELVPSTYSICCHLALAIFTFSQCSSALLAQDALFGYGIDHKVLRGIKGLQFVVIPASPAVPLASIPEEIRAQSVERLSKVGITIEGSEALKPKNEDGIGTVKKSRLAPTESPKLLLTISVTITTDSEVGKSDVTSITAVDMDLELKEEVFLKRNPAMSRWCTTWSRRTTVENLSIDKDLPRRIVNTAIRVIDDFALAYLSVNRQ